MTHLARTLLGTTLIFLTCCSTSLLEGACQDRAASVQVPVEEQESSETERCGFGISIFGIELTLFGPRCPRTIYTYPSHQTCGEVGSSPGHNCIVQGTLSVTREDCECSELEIPGLATGLDLPNCKCSPAAGNYGHVEDFQTQDCAQP